jgi:host factor-I protein
MGPAGFSRVRDLIGTARTGGSLAVESVNRKLIRPSLNEVKDQMNRRTNHQKKVAPPDQTNAENFYYMKQMQAKTPMIFVLKDGETLEGIIEWYDKTCLKINREGAPNLLIFKPNIKYMYKAAAE